MPPLRVHAAILIHEFDCRNHRSAEGPQDLTASGQGRPISTRTGTELCVILFLSPYLDPRGTLPSRHPLEFQKAVSLVCSTRRNGRRVQLSGDLLGTAEAERENCLEHLGGCDILRLTCPPRTIDIPNNLSVKQKKTVIQCEGGRGGPGCSKGS